MPTAVVYKSKFNWEKTNTVLSPVERGLCKVGYDVEIREGQEFPRSDEKKFNLACCWGDTNGTLSILASVKNIFPQVLQVDNSYLNRKRYEGHYGLTWGGQRQCHEYLWQSPRCPERFVALNETIKSWRQGGDEILLLAPSIKQGKILGFDTHIWAKRMVDLLSRHTKKRIEVSIKRYHLNEPLREVLQRKSIAAVVGYNTKGLVEALLEGIPIFNVARCVAEKMGLQDLSKIDEPFYPDNRLEFFERLAGTQFLLSEISEGIPFQERFKGVL